MAIYYPVYLNLKGKKCAVVGGGGVAQRKVQSLLKAGAKVTLISPELTTMLQKLALNGAVTHVKGEFSPEYIDGAALVIAATNDRRVNSCVASEANKMGVLVNVVDSPSLCDFVVPSVVRRGDLLISISTGGKSPALSKKIRLIIERMFGKEYGLFLKLMEDVRKRAQQEIKTQRLRSAIFKRLVDSDMIELLRRGEKNKVEDRIASVFDEAKADQGINPQPGSGPGEVLKSS